MEFSSTPKKIQESNSSTEISNSSSLNTARTVRFAEGGVIDGSTSTDESSNVEADCNKLNDRGEDNLKDLSTPCHLGGNDTLSVLERDLMILNKRERETRYGNGPVSVLDQLKSRRELDEEAAAEENGSDRMASSADVDDDTAEYYRELKQAAELVEDEERRQEKAQLSAFVEAQKELELLRKRSKLDAILSSDRLVDADSVEKPKESAIEVKIKLRKVKKRKKR